MVNAFHTKIRISFSSRSLSRISAAFSKSRFLAASFISFVSRRDRFVEILPVRQIEARFRRRTAGHFEVIEVGHLHQIAVDRFDDRGRLDAVLLVVLLLDRAAALGLVDRRT